MDKYEITKESDSKKTGESDSDHELEINSLESVHLEENTAFEQSNAIEMSKPTANNSKGHDDAKEGHNLAQDIDRQKFNTDKHQSIIDINNDDVGYLSGGLGDVRNNIGKSDSRNRRLDTLLSIEMNSNSDEGSGNGDRSLKNAGPLGKIRLVAPTLSTRRQRRSTGHPSIKTLLSRNEGTQGGTDNSGTDNNMNSIENSDREFENMNLGGLDAIKEINEVHSEEQVESDESIAQSGESEPPPSLLVENAGLERNKRSIHRFKRKQTSKRHLNAGHTEGLYGNRASPRNLEVDRVRGRRLQGSRIGFGRENTLGTEYEYLDPGFSGATPSRSYRFSNVERGRESMDRIYEQDDTAPLIGTSVKKNKRGREQGKEKRKNNKNEQAYLQRALRDWRSQKLLDEFLARVYEYYLMKGIRNIILCRLLNFIVLLFVVFMASFLVGCVDHKRLRHEKSLKEVIIPQCYSKFPSWAKGLLYAFGAIWIGMFLKMCSSIASYIEMHKFFTEALEIEQADMDTVTWNEIVDRLVNLRNAEIKYKAKNRKGGGLMQTRLQSMQLDAHIIANRIMRRENYMLALINNKVVEFEVPVGPLRVILSENTAGERGLRIYTKVMEWNFFFIVMNYIFDENNRLRSRFLKASNRYILSEGLRRRFVFMGVVNLLLCPLIVIFLLCYSFFKYFEHFYSEPASIMSREFTPRAKLEFQNYNELPHAFERRIAAATSKSNIYLNQFPNHMVLILARFVGFVCGSVMAVLILFTVVDNELSLEFEITKNKTVLFYLGLLGAIVAGCRTVSNKSSPTYANNYTRVHPAWILRDVLEDLQYIPESWQNRLHTTWVKSQFLGLFDLKVVVFLHEILGIFTTPFVLMTSLSRSSIHIIDFFRENTKTLDKVGFVCKYADFELVDLNNSMQRSSRSSLSKKGNMLKSRIFDEVGNNAKMEMSFLQFKSEYPTWMPQNDQSVAFLGAAQEVEAEIMRERESFMFERPLPNLAGDVSTHLPYYEKNNFANKYSDRIRLNQSILPSGASIVLPNPVPKNKTGHKLPEGSSAHKGSIRNRASNKYEANQSKLFLSDLPLVNSQYDPNNGEASLNNSIYIPNNSTKANFFNYFSPGIFSVVNKLNSKNIF